MEDKKISSFINVTKLSVIKTLVACLIWLLKTEPGIVIFLSSIHYQEIPGTYPNIEQLIPDKFTNNFEKEFSFNCDYIGQFCNQIKKLSKEKSITFNGNNSESPFVISASWDIKNPFETLEGFNPILNYLIMPILKKD